jgi:hypothetical protein
MGGDLIDEDEVVSRCADEAGIDARAMEEWLKDERVEAGMRADMAAARVPSAVAPALDHKLAANGDGRRYTCPSYEITALTGGQRLDAPGFQPFDVYETLMANVPPALERRPPPESAAEVLRWAAEPLATAEVAAVMGVDLEEARGQLSACAEPIPMGTDALWNMPVQR